MTGRSSNVPVRTWIIDAEPTSRACREQRPPAVWDPGRPRGGRTSVRVEPIRQNGLDNFDETLDVQRLREEVVSSGGEQLVDSPLGRVGGDHHDRRVLSDRVSTEETEH